MEPPPRFPHLFAQGACWRAAGKSCGEGGPPKPRNNCAWYCATRVHALSHPPCVPLRRIRMQDVMCCWTAPANGHLEWCTLRWGHKLLEHLACRPRLLLATPTAKVGCNRKPRPRAQQQQPRTTAARRPRLCRKLRPAPARPATATAAGTGVIITAWSPPDAHSRNNPHSIAPPHPPPPKITAPRMSAALSAVTCRDVRVERVRAKRKPPGLRPQHLTGLQLIESLSRGMLTGQLAAGRGRGCRGVGCKGWHVLAKGAWAGVCVGG